MRKFRGRRLELEWDAGKLVAGEWPQGVRFEAEGRRVASAEAQLEPDTGEWRLSGQPVPSVADDALSLAAQSIRIGAEGGVRASKAVTLQLGGDMLAAAGPLFGTATRVDVRAAEATIGTQGVLTLEERVEIVWQEQSLVAGELRMERTPGRLHASDDVELVAVAKSSPPASQGPESPPESPSEGNDVVATADEQSGRFITVSAEDLLVEEESAEIRLAGDALLRHGPRRIRADKLMVQLDDSGQWSVIEAED